MPDMEYCANSLTAPLLGRNLLQRFFGCQNVNWQVSFEGVLFSF